LPLLWDPNIDRKFKGNLVKFGGELRWGRCKPRFSDFNSSYLENVQDRGLVTMDHL